jgi:uncharacterized protein YyaL (SSP411 family)
MGKNMFPLMLVLAGIVAASQAQGNSNHLSGQTSLYLKRAVSQPVDWCPWCILMDRETYTNASTADYINQHFVAVKVDFDSAPELVAQLQRAQAVLNLPAGLPLTSFITPDGKLYFGGGYLPSERKGEKPPFREAAEEALTRNADQGKIEKESFQLEIPK